MMFAILYSALRASAIFVPAVFTPLCSASSPSTTLGTVLKPIGIRDFERASGIERRQDSEDFSDLDLQTQSQLIYGSPGGNGQLLLANMTLFAPDGLEMVMMERFEGLTSAVDCHGDDGTMSLSFSSRKAFQYALKQWKHINDADDGSFLLIANHDGCGPDDERQPYLISKVKEDQQTMTTYLTAKTAPWSDIASTYDLDFGSIFPQHQHSTKRGLGGCVFGGDCDYSKSVTFDVAAGTKGQVTNIYSDDKFKLDCINCFTTGSFEVAGHISTNDWSLSALTLTATPHSLAAELELEATVTASNSPAALQYEKQLFSFPIPDAGISIAEIFTLGATISYDVGFTSTIQGTATLDFGLSAGTPDSAQLVADVKNPDSSSATGFGGGTVTPIFDVKQMSASLTLGAYSKPKLGFGVSLIKIGTAEVDISVKLPEVDVTFTADYNQAGVCNGSSSTTGIQVATTLDIEVDLDIEAKLGETTDTPSWSKNLFSITEPIASQCFPIQIPGLGSASIAIPTAVSTVPISSAPISSLQAYSASEVGLAPIINATSYLVAPSSMTIPLNPTGGMSMPSATSTGYDSSPIGVISTATVKHSRSTHRPHPPYPYSSHSTVSGASIPTGTGDVGSYRRRFDF